MNERINELIKQCTSWSNGYTWTSMEEFDKEKFAELIIFECTKIAVFKGDKETAVAIKEHFRVTL